MPKKSCVTQLLVAMENWTDIPYTSDAVDVLHVDFKKAFDSVSHIRLPPVWRKFLTGRNIDKFDEFLSIQQHFPYQNFPLIIFCHLPARPLFRAGHYR